MIPFKRVQSYVAVYGLILFVTVFSGCVSVGLQKEFPEIKTYALNLDSQAHAASPGEPVSIRLDSFSALPAFADRYLTYRTSETLYEQDFYNQLMTSPSGMIRDQVLIWLKGSPKVAVVLPGDSTVDPDCEIDGKILELYGDYRREESPKAVLKIQFTVSDAVGDSAKVIFQKIYSSEIPIARPSPKELTEGWNAGLGQIMAEFENDLKKSMEKH